MLNSYSTARRVSSGEGLPVVFCADRADDRQGA